MDGEDTDRLDTLTRTTGRFVGYCDLISPLSIEGWAYDTTSPDSPLVMQVLIDGTNFCWTSCDLIRSDVYAAGHPGQQVGFFIALPPDLSTRSEHIIEFRDRDGHPISLESAIGVRHEWILPAQPQSERRPSLILGCLDEIQDSGITGWAYDPTDANNTVILEILIDGAFQTSVTCSLERSDVLAAGHPTSIVGFASAVPPRYFDGLPHMVEVRPTEGDVRQLQLGGDISGKSVFIFQAQTPVGRIDGFSDGAVRGWVFFDDRRTQTKTGGLQVLVSLQGHPVAQITANAFRPDVASAHSCDPNCGFAFFPPVELVAGRNIELEFQVIPGGYNLIGSPVRIHFPSLETAAAYRELYDATEKIFADLWLLRERLRRMAPGEIYTVDNYDPWARRYQAALAAAPNQLEALAPAGIAQLPMVSIICPTYKPRRQDFIAAVESVLAQTYPNWELIIVDDASRSAQLAECMAAYAAQDSRIKIVTHAENRGISSASNTAIMHATGEYIAFFDHDDLLSARAIEFMLAAALRTGAQMLYSDEDKIDDGGIYCEPNLKPDWNYRLLLSQNYICHLLMVERAQLVKVGSFRSACDGAQDHDIIIRLSEVIAHDKIRHVPEVLYHWRKTPSSTAASGGSKTYAVAAGARAIQDHLIRRNLAGRVHSPRDITCYQIDWNVAQEPSIAIIIPYREHIEMTRACVAALQANTDYSNYSITLVDNWSTSDGALSFAKEIECCPNILGMRVEEKYNFSRLNNLAVSRTDSEFLLFMNNDVFVSDPYWLRAMVGEMLADTRVAIVGNKLLYPTGLVQHAGVILGVGGIADHAYKGRPANDPGYVARAISAQDMSAVTAACMLCRRSIFDAVGGFDEQDLQVAYNDVDLCLKAGQAGYRVIWTPSSVAEHRESLSRGDDFRPERRAQFFHENETMRRRWSTILDVDRFYNRSFSRQSGIFTDLGPPSIAPVAADLIASHYSADI